MAIDINFLRGVSTILVFLSFIGVCLWAYSSKRKKTLEDAANIPFADEQQNAKQTHHLIKQTATHQTATHQEDKHRE